jgi:hypothetical protein
MENSKLKNNREEGDEGRMKKNGTKNISKPCFLFMTKKFTSGHSQSRRSSQAAGLAG